MHAVIHTVDCLRSFTVLWKALASKQGLMETLSYADTGHEGTWVLDVAKTMLDIVLSVAVSVILSLLLLSGDVEENPGPLGGMYIQNNNIILLLRSAYLTTQILIMRPLIQPKY